MVAKLRSPKRPTVKASMTLPSLGPPRTRILSSNGCGNRVSSVTDVKIACPNGPDLVLIWNRFQSTLVNLIPNCLAACLSSFSVTESEPAHGEIIGLISRSGLSFTPLSDTKSVIRRRSPSVSDISSF